MEKRKKKKSSSPSLHSRSFSLILSSPIRATGWHDDDVEDDEDRRNG